jgi:hypothetical protein
MDRTQRNERRLRIAEDLDAAGYTAQATAIRNGELLLQVATAVERKEVEEILRDHGVDITNAWDNEPTGDQRIIKQSSL